MPAASPMPVREEEMVRGGGKKKELVGWRVGMVAPVQALTRRE